MEHAQTIPRRVRDVSRNGEVWELYEDDVYIGRTVEDLSDGRHEALAAAPAACRKVSSPAHPRGTWPSSLQAWKAVRNSWGADALETIKAEQKLDTLLAERATRLITLPPYALVEDSNGKKIRQRVWQTTDGEVTLHERDGEYEFRAIVGGFPVGDGWNRQYDSVQLLRRQAARLEHAAAFIESQREKLQAEAQQ